MLDDRKHLVSAEVEKLMEAAKGSRNAARDRCLLLLMFRHGLRVSEACGLRLSQVDIESRVLHVARLKQGLSTTHPLQADEVRFIKIWLAERAKMKPETDAFFVSERHGPLRRKTAWLAIRTYGERAGLPVDAHPHMPPPSLPQPPVPRPAPQGAPAARPAPLLRRVSRPHGAARRRGCCAARGVRAEPWARRGRRRGALGGLAAHKGF